MAEDEAPANESGDPDGPGPLGAPNQAAGSAAASATAQARRDALAALKTGDLGLQGLFAEADNERGQDSGRVFGHLHLRAVLVALPHIGELRADQVLQALGVRGDMHLADLGTSQRVHLQELLAAYTPS